jgi:hypothetical protein
MSQEDVKTDISRSSNEKGGHSENLESPVLDIHGLPPDPDAHLSAEERAAIVRIYLPSLRRMLIRLCLGSQTLMEARFNTYSMALYSLSPLLPGSNEYRKCKDCRLAEGLGEYVNGSI